MIVVVWSPQAAHDLEEIQAYIEEDSPRYASLVVTRIVGAVERLATFPESGRVVPEFHRREIRELIVPPYRVVYRTRLDRVEIAAVFHAARLLRDLPI